MRYEFKLSIICPDSKLDYDPPTKTEVAHFIRNEALIAGGCTFPGDEECPPDWRFVLHKYGKVVLRSL